MHSILSSQNFLRSNASNTPETSKEKKQTIKHLNSDKNQPLFYFNASRLLQGAVAIGSFAVLAFALYQNKNFLNIRSPHFHDFSLSNATPRILNPTLEIPNDLSYFLNLQNFSSFDLSQLSKGNKGASQRNSSFKMGSEINSSIAVKVIDIFANTTLPEFSEVSTYFTPEKIIKLNVEQHFRGTNPNALQNKKVPKTKLVSQCAANPLLTKASKKCLDPLAFFESQNQENSFKHLSKNNMEQLFGTGRTLSAVEARNLYNRIAKGIKEFATKMFDSIKEASDDERTTQSTQEIALEACKTRHHARLYIRERGSEISQTDAEYMDWIRTGNIHGHSCESIEKKYQGKPEEIIDAAARPNPGVNWAINYLPEDPFLRKVTIWIGVKTGLV